MPTYRIVENRFRGGSVNVRGKRGLTLEEAQRICSDPETSSATATSAKAKRHTTKVGPWFWGYREDK